MRFEYDPQKSASNKIKHGVDFEEAQALWDDPYLLTVSLPFPDEARMANIGMLGGKLWTAVTTERGDAVRIISVRRSHGKEVTAYERFRI